MDYNVNESSVVITQQHIRSLKFTSHLITYCITNTLNHNANGDTVLWPAGISREITKYISEPSEEYLQTRINLISYALQKYFQKSNLEITFPAPSVSIHHKNVSYTKEIQEKPIKNDMSFTIAKWQQLVYNNIQPLLSLKRKLKKKLHTKMFSANDLQLQKKKLKKVILKDSLLDWIHSSLTISEIVNDSYVINYLSYIIALYAGGYGWFSRMNAKYLRYTHQGRIGYYKPVRDIACMVADEEIMASANYLSSKNSSVQFYPTIDMESVIKSKFYNNGFDNHSDSDSDSSTKVFYKSIAGANTSIEPADHLIIHDHNENKYYFCQFLVREKADEMWIGITWDFPFLATGAWAGTRDGTDCISYYGGRNSSTFEKRIEIAIDKLDDDLHAAFKKELKIKFANYWAIDIQMYKLELENLKEKFGIEVSAKDVCDSYSGSGGMGLFDCEFGAIHVCGKVFGENALEYYGDGDTVGLLVNCNERWVQFYNNGVKQGDHIPLPENVSRFWAYATADAACDQIIFDRQIWKAKRMN